MTALWILLGIIAAAALVIWSVDFYHYLVNRYCRYHIGRWPDTQAWQQAVIHRAIRWTVKTPTVKITDNNRYLLLDMLQGRHRSNTIQSWQTASLLLGLGLILLCTARLCPLAASYVYRLFSPSDKE